MYEADELTKIFEDVRITPDADAKQQAKTRMLRHNGKRRFWITRTRTQGAVAGFLLAACLLTVLILSPATKEILHEFLITGDNLDVRHLSGTLTMDGQFEYIVNTDQTVTITNYRGNDDTVIVPDSIESSSVSYPVAHIGDRAFYKNNAIGTVNLPSGIQTIGDEAFYQCKGLTEVSPTNMVTQIGNSAFYECVNLSSFSFDSPILTRIGDYAFYSCKKLTPLTSDPKDARINIGIDAFKGCKE